MKKLLVIAVCAAMLTGCAAAPRPTPQQVGSADFGPFPDNWKQIVSETIAEELVRPEEIYIRKMTDPKKTWVATPDGEILYGWGVCGFNVGRLNNLEPFAVFIESDKPIYKVLGYDTAVRVSGRTWNSGGQIGKAYDFCKGELFGQ